LVAALALPLPLAAQQVSIAAQAILGLRHHNPVPIDRPLAELRVVQPFVLITGSALDGHFALHAIVDLEGLTIPNAELTIGSWGEGFVDRRHPHTYFHEFMATVAGARGPLRGSITVGKGFAPFGTDDPMTRPPFSYPSNHHLSQVLERAVTIAALGAGPVVLEGALFNGDEPSAPDSWPNLERFGDSWALRVTVWPGEGWEGQISHASVASPEHRDGAGPTDTKWSASLRWSGLLAGGRPGGVHAEWAQTSEGDGVFSFNTALVEGNILLGARHLPYLRIERSERPEEERISDFRTPLPPLDDSITGISRWMLGTLGYRYVTRVGPSVVEPFVEATLGGVTSVGGGTFDPDVYYGGEFVAGLALGIRITYGLGAHRMGRYGVALPVVRHAH
jgi:hypothetical protein